jgi:outer membrane protein OmpA-like peptidoglycan-associated protein
MPVLKKLLVVFLLLSSLGFGYAENDPFATLNMNDVEQSGLASDDELNPLQGFEPTDEERDALAPQLRELVQRYSGDFELGSSWEEFINSENNFGISLNFLLNQEIDVLSEFNTIVASGIFQGLDLSSVDEEEFLANKNKLAGEVNFEDKKEELEDQIQRLKEGDTSYSAETLAASIRPLQKEYWEVLEKIKIERRFRRPSLKQAVSNINNLGSNIRNFFTKGQALEAASIAGYCQGVRSAGSGANAIIKTLVENMASMLGLAESAEIDRDEKAKYVQVMALSWLLSRPEIELALKLKQRIDVNNQTGDDGLTNNQRKVYRAFASRLGATVNFAFDQKYSGQGWEFTMQDAGLPLTVPAEGQSTNIRIYTVFTRYNETFLQYEPKLIAGVQFGVTTAIAKLDAAAELLRSNGQQVPETWEIQRNKMETLAGELDPEKENSLAFFCKQKLDGIVSLLNDNGVTKIGDVTVDAAFVQALKSKEDIAALMKALSKEMENKPVEAIEAEAEKLSGLMQDYFKLRIQCVAVYLGAGEAQSKIMRAATEILNSDLQDAVQMRSFLIDWIQKYDSEHTDRTYATVVKEMAEAVKLYYKDKAQAEDETVTPLTRFERMNSAVFEDPAEGICQKLFTAECAAMKLDDEKIAALDGVSVTDELSTEAEKQLISFAGYEFLRKDKIKKEEEQDTRKVFYSGLGGEEFDFTLANLLDYPQSADARDPQQPVSIYNALKELLDHFSKFQENLLLILKAELAKNCIQVEGDQTNLTASQDLGALDFTFPGSTILFEFDKPARDGVDSFVFDSKSKSVMSSNIPAIINVLAKPIADDGLPIKTYMDKIVIEGHTDKMGEDSYNQSLSERRAQVVRNFVMKPENLGGYDVAASGISFAVKGFGETYALGEGNHAPSRRVIFKLKLKGEAFANTYSIANVQAVHQHALSLKDWYQNTVQGQEANYYQACRVDGADEVQDEPEESIEEELQTKTDAECTDKDGNVLQQCVNDKCGWNRYEPSTGNKNSIYFYAYARDSRVCEFTPNGFTPVGSSDWEENTNWKKQFSVATKNVHNKDINLVVRKLVAIENGSDKYLAVLLPQSSWWKQMSETDCTALYCTAGGGNATKAIDIVRNVIKDNASARELIPEMTNLTYYGEFNGEGTYPIGNGYPTNSEEDRFRGMFYYENGGWYRRLIYKVAQ